MTDDVIVPSDEVKDLMKYLQTQSVSAFEAQGGVSPIFFLLLPNKQLMLVPANFALPGLKEEFALIIRRLIASHKAQAVAMVTEAWTIESTVAPGTTAEDVAKAINECGGIENHPNRTEVVQVLVSTPSYEVLSRAKIIRANPSDEHSAGLLDKWTEAEVKIDSEGVFTNWFINRDAAELEMHLRGEIDAMRKAATTPDDMKALNELEKELGQISGRPAILDFKVMSLNQLRQAADPTFTMSTESKKEFKN